MAITFTRTQQGTYDPEADSAVPTISTITGSAIQVRGDPNRYQALGLVESQAPTLWFTPTTYGDTPAPGDVTTWRSAVHTVRDVTPVGPDGVTIAVRVIIEK